MAALIALIQLMTLPVIASPVSPPLPSPLILVSTPLPRTITYTQKGEASFYGRWHHRRKMANGKRFDMNALTMASRTLPLGAVVRVTRMDNGLSVVVTVTDRGPYAKNRIADLSDGAARKIHMVKRGHAQVLIQLLSLKKGG